MTKEVVNVQIKDTYIGIDRNRLIFSLSLSNDDGLGCGFGCRLGREGSDLLKAVLETVGAESWDELLEKYVRVVFEDDRSVAIGHITKNKWLNLQEWVDMWKAEHGPEVSKG